MLGQRLKRWTNPKPTWGRYVLFAGSGGLIISWPSLHCTYIPIHSQLDDARFVNYIIMIIDMSGLRRWEYVLHVGAILVLDIIQAYFTLQLFVHLQFLSLVPIILIALKYILPETYLLVYNLF